MAIDTTALVASLSTPASRTRTRQSTWLRRLIIPFFHLAFLTPCALVAAYTVYKRHSYHPLSSLHENHPTLPTTKVFFVSSYAVHFLEVAAILGALLSVVSLSGWMFGHRMALKMYFGLLILLATVKLMLAAQSVATFSLYPSSNSAASIIDTSIRSTWEATFETEPGTVMVVQVGLNCCGYENSWDHAVIKPSSVPSAYTNATLLESNKITFTYANEEPNTRSFTGATCQVLRGCRPVLAAKLGPTVQRVEWVVLYLRLVQFFGALAFTALFWELLANLESCDEEDDEEVTSTLQGRKEKGSTTIIFVSEKAAKIEEDLSVMESSVPVESLDDDVNEHAPLLSQPY
ncbi:hypothetical protein HK102_010373 [Quaeritorhiza haematococci]|nr:hypothetical protein HK102_010373 [Quaeritorhiza haematococci]